MTRLPLAAFLALGAAGGPGCAPWAAPQAAEADAAPVDLWEWCPEAPASPAAVDEERLWVQFGHGALYCSLALPSWSSGDTAWDQLEDKAQLRLVPADNFLPTEAGEHALSLPLCSRAAAAGAPIEAEPGELVVTRTSQIGRTRLELTYTQTARDEDGSPLTARVRISGYEEDLAAGVLLDGTSWPLPDPGVSFALCAAEACGGETPTANIDACSFAGPRELHEVHFTGGELRAVVETRRGSGWTGNAPLRGHLVAASGVVDGEVFEQESYWRLIARETWPWSRARDFAVRFDALGGTICGLHGTQLYPDGGGSGYVDVVMCDGRRERREVLSHTLVLEDDEADAGPPAP